jgi:hypothetical protein
MTARKLYNFAGRTDNLISENFFDMRNNNAP